MWIKKTIHTRWVKENIRESHSNMEVKLFLKNKQKQKKKTGQQP